MDANPGHDIRVLYTNQNRMCIEPVTREGPSVGSVPLVESVPLVGSVPLSGGVVGVTVVPSEDDVNNTQLKLGHYNKHTQTTFHSCCKVSIQWITSNGGLFYTHCYNLCSVPGTSTETTHIEDISRVGCCGYGHVTTSWVNLDLILEGTVLKTCIPVVHL